MPALELPRLTLRVGLIGNLTADSGAALDSPAVLKNVNDMLEAMEKELWDVRVASEWYRGEKPTLRFVTGMASGADQILFQEALARRDERFRREVFVIYPYSPADYQLVNPRRPALPEQVDWSIDLDADHPPDPDPANPSSPRNASARRQR